MNDLVRDETGQEPLALHALELTIAGDSVGRVHVRIEVRARKTAVEISVPVNADHVEWFDPDRKRLKATIPELMWSVWRADTGDFMHEGRPASTLIKHVTVTQTVHYEATFDLAKVLGSDRVRHGWCARAWVVSGSHPVPSNIICWPRSAI